jgi:hypothetical protein
MKTLTSSIVVVFLHATLLAISSFAQFRASIQGTVTDANGALVPGAMVTLTSDETNFQRVVTTSNVGVYDIPGLAPGKYSLAVEKTGFSKKVLSDVILGAEQSQSFNVQLEVGQVSQTVTVSSAVAEVIDTETAMIGGTITDKQIQNMPSFGRDPYQLVRLAPGVFGDGALGDNGNGTASLPGSNIGGSGGTNSIFQVENGIQIVANGSRQNANDIQIDGVGVNSTSWGGAAVITPNEESVKEVRVIANSYDAQYGRTSGAQILVVSQNGTNELHGSGFFKWHRPGLDAYNRWDGIGTPSPVSRDDNRFNQFGGSLGGPIVKNKLFAFFSYETQRNKSSSLATAWYETPQFLQSAGTTGSIARTILSYPGEGPAPGKLIQVSCAQAGLSSSQCQNTPNGLDLGSPLTSPLGTHDPTFGQAATPFGIGNGFDGIPDAQELQTVSPQTATNVQYNGRVDYQATDKDRIAFSAYFTPVSSTYYNGPQRSANNWNHSQLAESWTGLYTRTISPTTLNEARFSANGWNWNEVNSNPKEPFGLPTGNISAIGNVNVQSFGAQTPSQFDQLTYNGRDTLTKVQNSHSLKFGADISHAQFLDTAPWEGVPSYNFNNLWDFANDAPIQENGTNFNPVTGVPTSAQKNLRFNIIGVFVQDDWKVKKNLTVNLGLRWEYFSPLTETKGNISNPILGLPPDPLAGLHLHTGGDLFGTSFNNFGPQIGFAYNPTSKLVFRGGMGIGYNLEQLAITSNGRFNPPLVVNLTLHGSDILYAPSSGVHDLNGYPSNPAAIQTFSPVTGLPISGAPSNLTGFPNFMPTTVTYRYSFDTQYDLGHNWMASLGYQGSKTSHATRQSNLSAVYYPYDNPNLQNLTFYSNDANAHSNALLGEVQHRFASNFEIDFQYRLARSIDQGSSDYNLDPYPWNYSYSTGPSDFDATHTFKLWGMWTPTLFRGGQRWLDKVVGGWTVSGILTAHTGFPWTPQYCGVDNFVNANGVQLYQNVGYTGCIIPASYTGTAGTDYSNSTFLGAGNFPNGALSYFSASQLNPEALIYAPPAANIHRNMFRGPGFLGDDFTLAKAFGLPKLKILGEGAKLNLQANFYNLFNKLNLTNINTTIGNYAADGTIANGNATFGLAQGAFTGRTIELQARFSF